MGAAQGNPVGCVSGNAHKLIAACSAFRAPYHRRRATPVSYA